MDENEVAVDLVVNNAAPFLAASEKVSASYDKMVADINAAAVSINASADKMDKAGDEMGGVAKDIDKVGDATDKTADEVSKDVGDIDTSLGKVETAAKQAGDGAQTQLKRIPDAAHDAAAKTGGAADIIKGVLMGIGAAALNMAADAGRAFVQFAGDSIKLAGDFEAGMNRFAVAAGKDLDPKGLEDFRDLFLDIGKRLPVSTMEVQEAAETLVKGGIEPEVIALGGLEDSIQFATAAGMDLNAAAELSIKTMGVFTDITDTAKEKTDFLAKSQNLLVKAAGASTLNVDNLGAATLVAAGQAGAAGVDYEDFVTTLGLISPAFNSAAEAGTSYKNFLVRLIPTTKPAIAMMDQLGLSSFKSKDAIEELSKQGIDASNFDTEQIIQSLYDVAEQTGLTEKETQKYIQTFTGSKFYDINGAFVGNAKTAELLKNATKDLTAEERVHAFQTIFGNDAMGSAIALAKNGADGYQAFADKMANASGVQETAAGKQKGFNVALDNFNGSVEALQITLGTLLLPILTDLFNNVLAPAINTITLLSSSFGTAGGEATSFAYAFGSLFNLGPETEETFGWISDKIGEAMGYIKLVISQVLAEINTFWKENGEEIMKDVSTLWEDVLGIIGPAVEIISFVVKEVFKDIAEFIADNGQDILKFLKNVWKLVFTVIDTALKLVSGVLQTVMFLIRGDWQSAWNSILQTLKDVVGGIITFIQTALNTILNLFGTNLAQLNRDVIVLMSQIVVSIGNEIGKAVTAIENFFIRFMNAGKTLIDKIGEGIASVSNTIANKVSGAVSDALNFTGNLADNILNFGKNIIGKIVDGVNAAANSIVTAITGVVQGAIDSAIASIIAFINNPLGAAGFNNGRAASAGKGSVAGSRVPYTYNPMNAGAGVSTTYQYNLSVATRQSDAGIVHQFNVMKAMSQ